MATDTQNPITQAYTYEQLQAQAKAAIEAQISGENAPLQAQVGSYTSQEEAARANIGAEFGSLMPYVQSSAQNVTRAQADALSMEQQIFQASGQRMNALHQQQAKEAQDLAQQMGGPVSTGDYTGTLAPYEQGLSESQGSTMLNALGNAMTDTVEAQKFAGQVFPAMQTEDQAKSDSYFRDQIKQLQDQINANEGQRSALTNSKLQELVTQERAFHQQQLQNQLDRKKAARDWKVQQQQIAASKLSSTLSKAAAKRANISLAQTGQRIQMEGRRLTDQEKQFARREGLSEAEFRARMAHEQQTAKQGQQRLSLSASKDAASVLDAAMGGGKPVSMTHRAYIPGAAGHVKGLKPPAGAYWDPKKNQWYRIAHETMSAGEWGQLSGGGAPHPVHDPNRLYDLVRGTIPQLGRKATINLVRAKTGLKGWSPGKQMPTGGDNLQSMSLGELKGLARDAGYKGPLGKNARKQAIVDFLMHAHPHPQR